MTIFIDISLGAGFTQKTHQMVIAEILSSLTGNVRNEKEIETRVKEGKKRQKLQGTSEWTMTKSQGRA